MLDSTGRKLLDTCPNCGKQNAKDADSRFCLACGKDLNAQPVPPPMKCAKCGRKLEASDRGCPYCRKRNIKIAIISAVVVCVVVAAIAIAMSMRHAVAYTVYYECNGEEVLAPKRVSGVSPGDTVTEEAPKIEGYTAASPQSRSVTLREGVEASITFTYYEESSTSASEAVSYTVSYLDSSSGEKLLADAENDAKAGEIESIDVPDINDYEFERAVIATAGDGAEYERTTYSKDSVSFTFKESETTGSVSIYYAEKKDDPKSDSSENADDYIIPGSDATIVTTDELEGLDDTQLCYARNELFARHGASFGPKDLKSHFNSKGWYKAIKPKTKEYGTEILNPIESTNAYTIRRVELSRGSSNVGKVSEDRKAMQKAYLSKVSEYQSRYGTCEETESDTYSGLDGLCLVQLVDFERDNWEELLIAYHDDSNADESDSLAPSTYTVEVWAYDDGSLSRKSQNSASEASSSGASCVFIYDDGDERYLDEDGSEEYVYFYRLANAKSPSAGDGYWNDEADVALDVDNVQSLTAETLRNLESD